MTAADVFLAHRRAESDARLRRVQDRLRPIEPLLGNFATVYVTGSYGRGEASAHSDLDVFILTDVDDTGTPKLRDLETIRLQAALIEAVAAEKLPEFSGDGKFLERHSIKAMIDNLGRPADDYENLFTARMLLLLESRPLLGGEFYDRAIERVIDEYWRDYQQNATRFLPIYLTNDLIRYWKVLCLNYEANTRGAENPNKRRLTNYKLKYSRLLTCYSALLYFCHQLKATSSITTQLGRDMTRLTPTERLGDIRPSETELVDRILDLYVEFLQSVDEPKEQLLARFGDPEYRGVRRESGQNFGDLIFKLLQQVGSNTRLLRYLVV